MVNKLLQKRSFSTKNEKINRILFLYLEKAIFFLD